MQIKFNAETKEYEFQNENKEVLQSLSKDDMEEKIKDLTFDISSKLEIMNSIYQALVKYPDLGSNDEY
ncbi:hypothetical protein [Arcobacter sp. F2176]|uniref:hypothetical protein n=1 Tax=Arcobacter sp. F2176 TaxID=2044511 RepID=UPI00100AD58E|nr:hypothetical protein [Arcobacter sp. F2176]RXJ82167.1 hypothetical protein CRU95_04580 [Arcobacter sp. F2176]